MSGENTKVYHKQGGDELVVANGGKITIETGAQLNIAGVDLAAFPTADPTDGVTIWNDNGTLKVATTA